METIQINQTYLWFKAKIYSRFFDIHSEKSIDGNVHISELFHKIMNKKKERRINEIFFQKEIINWLSTLNLKDWLFNITSSLFSCLQEEQHKHILSYWHIESEKQFFNADLEELIQQYYNFSLKAYKQLLWNLEQNNISLNTIANNKNNTLQETFKEIENIIKQDSNIQISYNTLNNISIKEIVKRKFNISKPQERKRYDKPELKDRLDWPIGFFENIFWVSEQKQIVKNEMQKVQDEQYNNELLNRIQNEAFCDIFDLEKENYEHYQNTLNEVENKDFSMNNTIQSSINKYISSLQYPKFFSKEFATQYNKDNKMLIIEFRLPALEDYPLNKEVKYITSKNEVKNIPIPKTKFNKMFEDTTYLTLLMILQTIHKWDVEKNIEIINLNWWINGINKAKWLKENVCIASIQATKEEILPINLEFVDPKECFKSLKWIWSTKLSSITPIQPTINIDKDDSRFVSNQDVLNSVHIETNLASMNREDFEHLIREIFEKEFSWNWWEVKVTQWSKDWWVDAIAFDPDPIRWWKIVIQAKRYTNTVWVSAVRDLYWTVMNEWATKWILVTTSDFWPDAFKFCKWKPITLMNWSNLLHLLQKHWKHAMIDIKSARKELWL